MYPAEGPPDASHMDDSLSDHPPHALGGPGRSHRDAPPSLPRMAHSRAQLSTRPSRNRCHRSACRYSCLRRSEDTGWTRLGATEEAVTAKKRREIEAVALAYLTDVAPHDLDFRFDVVTIEIDAGRVVRCEHIEDAWRPSPPAVKQEAPDVRRGRSPRAGRSSHDRSPLQ